MKQQLNNAISQMFNQSLQGNKNSLFLGLIYILGGQFLFINSIFYTHYKLLSKVNKLELQFQNLIEFLQYLNPHFYQQMCYSISIVDLFVLAILTGFFSTIIFILHQFNKDNKLKIIRKHYGQVFIKTYDFFVLLGFYPMILILLSTIRCIYANIEQIYFMNEYFIITLSILNIIAYFGIIISSIFYSSFYFNEWCKKKDFFTRKQGYLVIIHILIKQIILTILIFEIDEIWYYVLLIYIYLIFSIILIIINLYELNFHHYQQPIIRFTYLQSILIQFSVSFSLLLHYYLDFKPLFFIIIVYGLTFFIFNTILRKLQLQTCFIVPKNIFELSLKLQSFLEFQKNNQLINQVGDLIYFGEIYHHLAYACKNQLKEFGVRCFCSMKIMFDAKIQKDVRKNVQAISHNRSTFKKLLIKSQYEIAIQKNSKDLNIRLAYAQFLYFKMNNKLQALQQLKILQANKFNIYAQFRISQLLDQIKQDLIDINSLAYHSFLDFEYVIEMEETVNSIYQEMMKTVNLFLSFWRKLNQFPQSEDIQIKINQDINKSIYKCDQLWNNLKKHEIRIKQQDLILSYLNKKQKWMFLNFWYRLFIGNKKIRISQIECHSSSSLRQEMVNEDSDSDYEVKGYEQFVNQKPFNHTSIIIHSLLNGDVINQSQTCKEILEYDNLKSIYQIIPDSFQRNHSIAIKNLINNGKSKNLYKSKRIFIKHSQGYIIQARKYLKWYLNIQNQPIFIAMLRPIIRLEQINFIILNGDWEVDAVTPSLQKILDKNTCLLLLCTGLFQFSQFSQFLEIEDKFRFKINQPSRTMSLNQSKLFNPTSQDQINTSQKRSSQEKFFNDLDDQSFGMFANEFEELGETFNRKFYKIVDEQHVKLTLRLPKHLTDLNQEYHQLKQLTYQDIVQSTIYSTGMSKRKKHRLVIRNSQGKLVINKLILFRKLYDFKQKMIKQMYENLKDLFDRYCSQNRLLERLIKLDASIHFTKSIAMDKFTIIKINKYDIFEYHQKQFRETHNVLSESRVRQSRPSLAELYMDQRAILLQQQINNSEVDSNRIDQNKSFLTEGQIFPEFITYHPTEVVLKLENNIFIKQDNNKVNKKISEIGLFTFFNRLMIFTLCLLTAIGFFKGPSISYNSAVLIELEELISLKEFTITIIQTYEYALDNCLFKNYESNITSIYVDEYQQQKFQTIQKNYDKFNQSLTQQEFIEIYYGYEILDIPINDYFSQFLVNLHFLTHKNFTIINAEFDLLQQLRQLIIPGIQNGILQSYIQKFKNFYTNLQEQQNFATVEIVLTICFILLYLITNNILIVNVINKNKTIIRSLKLLNRKQIFESLQYATWLKVQLKFLKDLETMRFFNSKTSQSSYCDQLSKYDLDQSGNSKSKNNQYIESKVWIKITIQIIFSYLILNCIITVSLLYYQIFLLEFQNGSMQLLDQNQFIIHTEYLFGMVFIKEFFLYQQLGEQNIYINSINQSISNFISEVNSFNDEVYETNLDEITELFFGNYCDLIQDQICEFKLDGAFTRGLNQYNLLLSQIAIVLQNPSDTRYDYPTINKIFEFSDQQQFVYDISLSSLIIWRDQFRNYVENKIFQDLIYVIIMLVFSTFIYFIFIEYILVRTLRKQYKQSLKYVHRYYSNDVLNQQKNIRVIFVRLGLIQK